MKTVVAHAPAFVRPVMKSFITQEIMRWSGVGEMYGPFLRGHTVFRDDKLWEDLHKRVIEHVSSFDRCLSRLALTIRRAEYPYHRALLYPNNIFKTSGTPRIASTGSRGNSLQIGCFWHCLGQSRPTSRHHQLPQSQER